ncbi:MAG: flagellar biosynthesis protein FlhF [Candidatus Lambdaproteobacteria bacterium]|nr:flagellar biosynthesis protein FlhF [Candidatus Lambdaproteobacteria bacterium]
MQIKRFRGADMQETLAKVKKDLGGDAVILSTRKVRGGVGAFGLFGKPMLEVTAARDLDDGSEEGSALLANLQNLRGRIGKGRAAAGGEPGESELVRQFLVQNRSDTHSLIAPLHEDIQELRGMLQLVGESQRHQLQDEASLQQIRRDLTDLRQMMQTMSAHAAGLREADLPENLLVLYQQLVFNGLEEKFARRLVEESQKTIPANQIDDFAYVKIFVARMLMKIVKVTGGIQPEPHRQKIFGLVGPTGVGKTTTVAKLASEQLLKHRRNVALITVDTFRIAAVEQLKVYAKIMGVPITVVSSKAELRMAIGNFGQADVIFIDTGGRSQRDDLQMSEIRHLLADEREIEVTLTLSATTKDSDLAEITRRFGEIPLSSVVFTKLDESTLFGPIFNHAIRFKLPISYLTTGQKVPEDLETATKERLVDLLLNISGE